MHLHPTRPFIHILVGRFFSSHSTFRLQIDCSSMMLYELPLILWKCLVMSRSHLNHPKEIWFCDFSLHLLNNFRLQMNEANRNRPHETKERGPRGLKDAYNAYIYIYISWNLNLWNRKNKYHPSSGSEIFDVQSSDIKPPMQTNAYTRWMIFLFLLKKLGDLFSNKALQYLRTASYNFRREHQQLLKVYIWIYILLHGNCWILSIEHGCSIVRY